MIIIGDNGAEIIRLQDALIVRFEIKGLGKASCFLGLEDERSDGYIVSQKRLCREITKSFQYGGVKSNEHTYETMAEVN